MLILNCLMSYCIDSFYIRYARDVKRQKMHPGVLTELIQYLETACPVKSGSQSKTHRQYITDDALYQEYMLTTLAPVCLNTFMKIKQWMRVKHVGKYFGMFDCHQCYRLQQLPSLLQQPHTLDACKQYQQTHFHNAVSTR